MTNKKHRYKPVLPEVQAVVEAHGRSPEAVLEVVRDLQALPQGLTSEVLADAARALGVPGHRTYGVATFYSLISLQPREHVLHVCDSPACWLKHASGDPLAGFKDVLPPGWTVERSSCLGMCDHAPAALADDVQVPLVSPQAVEDITHAQPQNLSAAYRRPRDGETRAILADIDLIDPDDLQSARQAGVYDGLRRALSLSPEQVRAEVEAAGLQGRGGAGFPTARKWGFVAQAEGDPKYVICNADESEPLVFKDRVLMDTNPHLLLEGLAVAAYACGAREGWIYIRGEYEQQAQRLERAIAQAEAAHVLGEQIFGSDFSFKVHVHRGAGAYICGEETALIESLEGKRGEPRLRPPYPPQYGFRGKPTAVNNVETLAAAAVILRRGADWWRGLSNYKTPGTKLYMLLGHVRNPGLFEAPFGLTLRQLIDDFGGGMQPGSEFKFALCGGAAGSIVDESLLDVPLDYGSARQGISLGAGAFLVADQSVSVVAFLRELLRFFSAESCGKCTPCRVGTRRAFDILQRMAAGDAQPDDPDTLCALAENLEAASFCGLGQSVAIPMFSAMTHFMQEFASRAGKERIEACDERQNRH